jgi:hypothetical protein
VDANQEFAAKYGEKYSNGIDFHNGEVVGSRSSSKQTYADSLDAL